MKFLGNTPPRLKHLIDLDSLRKNRDPFHSVFAFLVPVSRLQSKSMKEPLQQNPPQIYLETSACNPFSVARIWEDFRLFKNLEHFEYFGLEKYLRAQIKIYPDGFSPWLPSEQISAGSFVGQEHHKTNLSWAVSGRLLSALPVTDKCQGVRFPSKS